MPAATTKPDLLAVFDTERARLQRTLDRVDAEAAALSAPGDGTTIKGVVAHRTHWMGLFHGWYDDGVAGRPVHLPAKGYKWSELKAYNAPIYAAGDAAPWPGLLAAFETACDRLRAFIAARDAAELYGTGVHGWTGKWTLGRYAEAAGPSHFRSANTYIRKVLRHAG